MFNPKYSITERLLANIKRINSIIYELNDRRFPKVVLVELERVARAISAHASTSIEGNRLPLTEVKKILKSAPEHVRDSEKEVLNYNKALEDLSDVFTKNETKLTLSFILSIQGQVTKGLLSETDSGELRQRPVVVNDPRIGQVVYLPPDVKDVETLVNDLLNFVDSQVMKIDPLIMAGIFHKQFVLIHPFMDGNGRTTRLATKVLLAKMGLNTFNLFSFENYYNNNVTKYFDMVGERGDYYELAGNIDFTAWLEYFTDGLIDELLRVQGVLPAVGLTPSSELQEYHQKILAFINVKGFISDRDYAKMVTRARPTRALDFQKLIDLGLVERKAKGKATYYILKEN